MVPGSQLTGLGKTCKESLCDGSSDINANGDSCCVLNRVHNRFFTFVASLTLPINPVRYYIHLTDEETK